MAEEWSSTQDHSPLAGGEWASTTEHAPGAAAPQKHWLDSAAEFGKALWENVGGQTAVDLIGGASRDPVRARKSIDTAKNILMGLAQEPGRVWGELGETGNAMARGDLPGTAEHLAGSVPLIGAPAVQAGQEFRQGHYARGFGHALGLLAPFLAPEALALAKRPIARVTSSIKFPENPNPLEAQAFKAFEDQGGTVPAGVRSGNRYLQGVQELVDQSPVGAIIASRARSHNADVLTSWADELKQQAGPTPATPMSAGEGVNTAIERRIADVSAEEAVAQEQIAGQMHPQPVTPEAAGRGTSEALTRVSEGHGQAADASYAGFRSAENDPATLRRVSVQRGPVTQTETISMPVDLEASGLKAELRPILADMDRWWEPAKRFASRGYTALKSIVDGPSVVPATVAEEGLGGLKALAREAEGRNAGLAKMVIPQLQGMIDQTVGDIAGPRVLGDLRAGRQFTAKRVAVEEISNKLRQEPVQTFQQLTHARDSGIDLLRQVEAEVPDQMPRIGRAYFDGLYETAQTNPQQARAAWRKLGDETKLTLYRHNPALVQAADDFLGTAGDTAKALGRMVKEEPVGTFRRLVQPEDANIELLRQVAAEVPKKMPQVGRGWLQDTLAPTEEGGAFAGTDRAAAEWNKLGEKTKQLLFPDPFYRQELNNFFTARKRLGGEFNTSRSGQLLLVGHGLGTVVGLVKEPLSTMTYLVSTGALSSMMHSPQGLRAITRAMTTPPAVPGAAAAAAAAVLRMAGDGAQPLQQPDRPPLSSFQR